MFQSRFNILYFKDLLFFLGSGINGRGNHVRQRSGLLDGSRHLSDLGRQSRRQFDDSFKLPDDIRHQCFGFFVFFLDIFEHFDARDEIGLAVFKVFYFEPAQPLDQKLGSIILGLCHFENQGTGAHLGQVLPAGCRFILGLFRYHQADDTIFGHGFIDQLDGFALQNHQR